MAAPDPSHLTSRFFVYDKHIYGDMGSRHWVVHLVDRTNELCANHDHHLILTCRVGDMPDKQQRYREFNKFVRGTTCLLRHPQLQETWVGGATRRV